MSHPIEDLDVISDYPVWVQRMAEERGISYEMARQLWKRALLEEAARAWTEELIEWAMSRAPTDGERIRAEAWQRDR